MDLDDSELYWTRKQKGLATEKETEEYIRSLEEKIKELEKYEKYYQAEINLLDSYIPKSLNAINTLLSQVEEQQHKIEKLINANDNLKKTKRIKNMEYVNQNYVSKDKIKELGEQVHSKLDNNAIIRGYQIIIDEMFSKLLEKE